MGKKLVTACLLTAIAGTATLSFGAGFKINEQGAKAMGMANAFVAQADDPTAHRERRAEELRRREARVGRLARPAGGDPHGSGAQIHDQR